MPPGHEPVGDDELLYRRIPASTGWYDPELDSAPSRLAFNPNMNDTSGLSLFRAKHTTLREAAEGQPGKAYYVATLRAGDLRKKRIEVRPKPLPHRPGHVELPGLTYQNRRSDQAQTWMYILAEQLCLRVEGPFPGDPQG